MLKNLKLNKDHYASWIMRLGGARLVLLSLSLYIYTHAHISSTQNGSF